MCAQVDPSSTSGVSEYTVCVVTGLDLRFTLKAGKASDRPS